MTNSLQALFQAIARANNERELQIDVIELVGNYFAAKRYRLFLNDRLSLKNKRSKLFKLALSIDYNPVLRYVVEHHAPIHETLLMQTSKWRKLCPRFDHGHVMAGPILLDGSLVGGLALTRDRNSPAFDTQNIADLSALCLHLSTKLTKIQTEKIEFVSSTSLPLTPRELQIAELVGKGFTNAEIGKQLWITENSVKQALKRMFRKLNVASRAEMIAKLILEIKSL